MKSNILFPVLLTIFLSFINLAEAQNYFYSEVENLSVRREPDLKSKRIAKLTEGERVTDLGRTSRNEISVKLRGTRTSGPFFLIRTRKGIEGWAYSRGLSNRPVYVEDYVCVVFFSKYGSLKSTESYWEDELTTFERECFDFNDNFSVQYISSGFREINIRSSSGEIIGVESISRLVDKYGSGVAVLEKGKKPKYDTALHNFAVFDSLSCYYGNCRCGD